MPFYKITLTRSGGLTDENVENLIKYFTKQCKHAYLVNEYGESGSNSHIEGVVEFDTEKTFNVTRAISNVYLKLGIEVIPGITMVVKSVYSLQGCLSYASKELREKGHVVLLIGWEESWIKNKTKLIGKRKSPTTLLGLGKWVTKRTAPAEIYTWCQTNNRKIACLRAYREVLVSMGEEQYMFDKGIHKCTYANVMSLFEDGSGIGQIIDDECRFLML